MSYKIKADLHIHSCLSPCASLENSPSAIVKRGVELGLDMIALTDHNSGRNLPAFFHCAEEAGLIPIAGMELTAMEEVHLLAFLPSLEVAMTFSDTLYKTLPHFPFDPEKMGDQVVVDEKENILEELERYLGSALPFTLEELVEQIHHHGGIAVPAHIDRFGYGLPAVLGFIPDLPFDGMESYQLPCPVDCKNYNVISNSDAHYLDDVGIRFNQLNLEIPDFEGLKQWFENKTP